MGLTMGQKVDRVLQFLGGLARPGVAHALAAHGFTKANWDEGWQLLRASVGASLARPRPTKSANPTLIDQLDAWENLWFPVAQATLRRRKPAAADELFLNLSQTSDVGVVITVSTFTQRVRQLGAGGPDGQETLALLSARGLSDEVLAHAEALLERLGDVDPDAAAAVHERETAAARREQADEALWSWYREWSTIARSAVHDRNLLRGLGFDPGVADAGVGRRPSAGVGQ
jgi:hypothetical protein